MSAELSRLLQHAQRLARLGSPEEILIESCRELTALTCAKRVYASLCLPGRAWESGLHIDCNGVAVDAAARSALHALHRMAVATSTPFVIARDDKRAAIFRGLQCDTDTMHVIPLVHRTRRVWGELVVFGNSNMLEGIGELAQLIVIALENAQRLAFARRDQDRLILLAEATNDALYDWHFDAREFWWGGGILKLLGSDADPVENTARWKLERIHPDDADAVQTSFVEARDSKAMQWTAEYRFRRHDHTYIHVEDRGYFLRDVSGRAYRIIGSIHDVTAKKSLLTREKQARAEAEAASRAKDEFLAMLGHELRNPLAPIVTGLDLLRMRGTPGIDRELTVLQRQAEHLIRLVDDLLDISRIAHGKIQLKKERVCASIAVSAAIETARPLIEARSHTIDVDVPSDLFVDADRSRLTQAIANLVNNAAKYTEPGGKIVVTARREGNAIAIRIRDSGIGIDPDMLPHVFKMFVQERQALDRSQGGLGLGLAIVHSLVSLHGGTVEATSRGRGYGSEFTVRIPAASAVVASAAAATTERAPHVSGRKIMVVDDNTDAADMLSLALEAMGNTTRIAHDAESAMELVEEFAPDLAVLDIGLPIVDGYELATRIRARENAPRLIALTGYGQSSDKERAKQAGFDAHLVKPIELGKLKSVIERLTVA